MDQPPLHHFVSLVLSISFHFWNHQWPRDEDRHLSELSLSPLLYRPVPILESQVRQQLPHSRRGQDADTVQSCRARSAVRSLDWAIVAGHKVRTALAMFGGAAVALAVGWLGDDGRPPATTTAALTTSLHSSAKPSMPEPQAATSPAGPDRSDGGALPAVPVHGGCIIGLNCGCIPNLTCPGSHPRKGQPDSHRRPAPSNPTP